MDPNLASNQACLRAMLYRLQLQPSNFVPRRRTTDEFQYPRREIVVGYI